MIVLLGYMGSGKSSISKYLKSEYSLKHCDLDDYIEMKENRSIADIFKEKGEIYFRTIENLYLKEIISQKNIDLLALGGGTPCYANNMEVINSHKTESFYLKVDLDELTNRLFKDKLDRPLIKNIQDKTQLKDFIRKHLFEREYYYRQAKHVFSITNMNTKEAAEKIFKL
jgi:shikimate kinase